MSKSGLTSWQRRKLQRRLNTTQDTRGYRRMLAVLEVTRGRSVSDVARELGVTRQSVHNWVGDYLTSGDPECLLDAERTGRPSVWTSSVQKALEKAMKKLPDQLGYWAMNWTIPLLREHLTSETDATLSDSCVRRHLKELGYVWKRSQYVLKPDPEREKKTTDSPQNCPASGPQRGALRG